MTTNPSALVKAKSSDNKLTLNAYIGVDMVMLAMNLDESEITNLAGFAIKCTSPDGKSDYLLNRLSFKNQANFAGYHADTKPEDRKWFSSLEAPFQYFRWLHVPGQVLSGTYIYEVSAMYFQGANNGLKEKTKASVSVVIFNNHPKKFDFGFTKGYLSSQAYADKFNNKDIRPKGTKTIDFDTKPFKSQYEWLGGKVNKMLFDFLKECANDNAEVCAMIYDCDHPDFIQYLSSFGKKLYVILDDAPLHTDADKPKPEDQVFDLLYKTTHQQIVRGHFNRFQHNKVLIKIENGTPTKVFTGSANFSIRGLYVQANNCMVIEDADVAKLYTDYFDQVYELMRNGSSGIGITKEEVTEKWYDFNKTELPVFSICLSPHSTADISLDKLKEALNHAESSVLFSVMQINGGGEPLSFLRSIPNDSPLFHYGIVQSISSKDGTDEKGNYDLVKQGKTADTVPFGYLKDKVPFPFQKEFSGGMGQVIHDKFVVIDFTSNNPIVFTGSSNLSDGGEKANGDNLIAIYDQNIAIAFGIEAVRLFDHYSFRYAMNNATVVNPLALDNTDNWVKPFYEKDNRKYRDRLVFGGKN